MRTVAILICSALGSVLSPAAHAFEFPVILTGQDCVNAQCFETTWTLFANGTFTERNLSGTYTWIPGFGGPGAGRLELAYDPAGPWPYTYQGHQSGTCVSGDSLNQGGGDVGSFDACLVQPVDGFDWAVGAPNGVGYYNAQDFTVGGHCGEDLNGNGGGNTDYGDPVYAIADGVVKTAADEGAGWGDIITVTHALPAAGAATYKAVESQYAHLSAMYVNSGDTVRRGDLIGAIGDADGAYIAHLHFEMRWDENQPPGGTGYDCWDTTTGMFDPSDFIDTHRPPWP